MCADGVPFPLPIDLTCCTSHLAYYQTPLRFEVLRCCCCTDTCMRRCILYFRSSVLSFSFSSPGPTVRTICKIKMVSTLVVERVKSLFDDTIKELHTRYVHVWTLKVFVRS